MKQLTFIGIADEEDGPYMPHLDSVVTEFGFTFSSLTVPFKSVVSQRLVYVSGSIFKRQKPKHPTMNGDSIPNDYAPAIGNYPRELMFDRAKRYGALDTWTARLTLELTHGRRIVIEGAEAEEIAAAYTKYALEGRKKNKRAKK